MPRHVNPFIVFKEYDDGAKLLVARNQKYRGFMYHLRSDEKERDHLNQAFALFKAVVNGDIFLESLNETIQLLEKVRDKR